jgi:hypothetical protein
MNNKATKEGRKERGRIPISKLRFLKLDQGVVDTFDGTLLFEGGAKRERGEEQE